jgi:SAM-dependent methyltransferase
MIEPPAIAAVQATLAHHVAMYRWHRPGYQLTMLDALAGLWKTPHQRLLDIGGGTGLIAQAIQDHFPAGRVTAVDVEDRFLASLSVETLTYDGIRLPFADSSFDAATMMNVLHHVPLANRATLIAEIRRVVRGPLYIKDHLSSGRTDDLRLAALDWIGNTPFKGMVWARYLAIDEWRALAARGGYTIAFAPAAAYRRGPFALAFPNRLEIMMKWVPDSQPA